MTFPYSLTNTTVTWASFWIVGPITFLILLVQIGRWIRNGGQQPQSAESGGGGSESNEGQENRILKVASIVQCAIALSTAIPLVFEKVGVLGGIAVTIFSFGMKFTALNKSWTLYAEMRCRRKKIEKFFEEGLHFPFVDKIPSKRENNICSKHGWAVLSFLSLAAISVVVYFFGEEYWWITVLPVISCYAPIMCVWLWAAFCVPGYYRVYGVFLRHKCMWKFAIVSVEMLSMSLSVAVFDTLGFYFVTSAALPFASFCSTFEWDCECASWCRRRLNEDITHLADEITLVDVVSNPELFLMWVEYLGDEFATENMLFLVEYCNYKHCIKRAPFVTESTDIGWNLNISKLWSTHECIGPIAGQELGECGLEEVYERAKHILRKYIDPAAGYEINISSDTRSNINALFEPATIDDGLVSANDKSVVEVEEELRPSSIGLSLQDQCSDSKWSRLGLEDNVSLSKRQQSVALDTWNDHMISHQTSVSPDLLDVAQFGKDGNEKSASASVAEFRPDVQDKFLTVDNEQLLTCFDEAAKEITNLLQLKFGTFRSQYAHLLAVGGQE